MATQEQKLSKRGLASASKETRDRVSKAGGEAPHSTRGLQGASLETRLEVARKAVSLEAGREERNQNESVAK